MPKCNQYSAAARAADKLPIADTGCVLAHCGEGAKGNGGSAAQIDGAEVAELWYEYSTKV